MFYLIISFYSIIMGILFIQMKHPLAMGMMLLIQTFLICLMTGMISKSFWFSYILFLIFLGGMLVLFIYVTSVASNEMFSISSKMILFMIFSMMILLFFSLFIDKSLLSFYNPNLHMMNMLIDNTFINENSLNLNKLYNFPTNIFTLLLMNYLFFTLIIVMKITNMMTGPLRSN